MRRSRHAGAHDPGSARCSPFCPPLLLPRRRRAAAAARDSLDAVARDYVQFVLELGERDDGYVDAYYGPAAWRTAARANPRTLPQLAEAARGPAARGVAHPAALGSRGRAAPALPLGQIDAAITRLRMLQGERLSFREEARGLYGVDPQPRPLSDFDPVLARIDRLVPGEGPLAARVDAFMDRFVIPRERLDAVMRAAIAECRRRTVAHIPLPRGEHFTLEFVTGRSWSGYNWYQGNYDSLIQVNTDQPVRMGRAIDLGCHEGYPGHHVYNMLLERNLARGRGWVEFQVYPLYSPQSFIAEGSANYGIELAFPGQERLAFERRVLYPLAGISDRRRGDLHPAAGRDPRAFRRPHRHRRGLIWTGGSTGPRRSGSPSATTSCRRRGPRNRSPSPSIIAPM